MKTGLEYLDLLSKADQVRFLKNLSTLSPAIPGSDNTISEYLSKSYNNFHSFINNSFHWESSSEGYDYWSKISMR